MPKDTHPPAFRFYVDDFISDSAVDAMTNEELGIYVRFLCKAWKEDPVGTIPDDDRILANWAKATTATWKKCKAGVLRAFTSGGDGRYHQKRMKVEWEKAKAYHEERSKAGAKGSKSRWQSDGSANGKDIAKHMASGMANDGISSSLSESCSVSDSVGGDDDGALEISCLGGDARARAMASRIQKIAGLDWSNQNDRSLVAKVAVLWGSGDLSDDDIEQVLESFKAGKSKVRNGGAWLYKCLENRCKGRPREFAHLLAATAVPIGLLAPQLEAGK